jgi:hypothetical protein
MATTGEFAHGKVDPVEAGKSRRWPIVRSLTKTLMNETEGGLVAGGHDSAETQNNTNQGGSEPGEFAYGRVDPVEAGRSMFTSRPQSQCRR